MAVSTISLGLADSTTSTNTISQVLEDINSHLPVNASISDTDTLKQVRGSLGRNLLVTLVDVGLDHNTNDTSFALAQLVGDLLGDAGLVQVVLLGVTVRTIDHENLALLLRAQSLARTLDRSTVVVCALVASAQDDEAVLVTGCLGDGSQTLLGDTEEAVGVCGGADGVNGDGQVTVGAVLVSDGEGQTGGQLAVELGLSGAGSDGAEGDQVGQVLGGDGVQHFAGDGEASGGEVDVELAGDAQALVDLVGLVHVGVVDQTLPADCGAGLLQVGAHDNAQVLGELGGELLQATSVLEGSVGIVNGAGTDHDQETVIALLDNLDGFIAAGANGLHGTIGLHCMISLFVLHAGMVCWVLGGFVASIGGVWA